MYFINFYLFIFFNFCIIEIDLGVYLNQGERDEKEIAGFTHFYIWNLWNFRLFQFANWKCFRNKFGH